jgi:predicted RNA-binding protein with PIN domain
MHLVIDGYNLLHNTPELALAQNKGQGRAALLKALKIYRDRRRHKLTVVFDGGPDAAPSRASESGVPVVYSGAEQSADDVIAEMSAKHGPGVTVITDDRELTQRCMAKGSEVIASWEFAVRLMEAAQGKVEGLEPPSDESGWDFTTKRKARPSASPRASAAGRAK